MFTRLKKEMFPISVNVSKKKTFLKLISLKKIKNLKEIKKELYEKQLFLLNEKIIEYVKNEFSKNSLLISKTKIFVPVFEEEILSSFPRSVFFRLTKKNNFLRRAMIGIKNQKEQESIYLKYYFPVSERDLYDPKAVKFRDLSRRQRWNLLKYRHSFKLLTKALNIKKRGIYKIEENPEKSALMIGFLNFQDANIYKNQLIDENTLINDNYIVNNLNSVSCEEETSINPLEKEITINPISLENFYKSFSSFFDMNENSIENISILIPEFFIYKTIDNKTISVKKNFPKQMLSKEGFVGIPVYKTKLIEKKYLISTYKNESNLKIPTQYLKNKDRLITINKTEYELLKKTDKKNLICYKKENDFIDTYINPIFEKNKNYFEQTKKIIKKIRKKCKTINDVDFIYKFILENFCERNLLEKTSYYIDTIKKN
uniref:hypothetical protein n=1 Tax=Vacuolaria virescens TaxID=44451 RepID=UPI0021140A1A|nr:hypothetical protein NQY37_pgp099 [Vacuolaria virescens]UTE94702.1 hypothetical protein VvirPt_p087 [Vacuolaria virescens]